MSPTKIFKRTKLLGDNNFVVTQQFCALKSENRTIVAHEFPFKCPQNESKIGCSLANHKMPPLQRTEGFHGKQHQYALFCSTWDFGNTLVIHILFPKPTPLYSTAVDAV